MLPGSCGERCGPTKGGQLLALRAASGWFIIWLQQAIDLCFRGGRAMPVEPLPSHDSEFEEPQSEPGEVDYYAQLQDARQTILDGVITTW